MQASPTFFEEAWSADITNESTIIEILKGVTTATISTILLEQGLRNDWLRGTRPLQSGQPRVAGRAFTLRFVPAREDLATPESWSSPKSTRAAIEAMPDGAIAVAGAMGVMDAGIFGDILCSRMAKKGRCSVGDRRGDPRRRRRMYAVLPVWCAGAAAPPSIVGLTFISW